MTEIKIEKKKPVLPWVLGLLLIVAVVLYFLVTNKKETTATNDATASAELINVHENEPAVAAYVSFINSDTNKMSLSHDYTNAALLKLTNATEAMAKAAGYSVKADLDSAKEYANKITTDQFETTHADNIKRAADIIANALHNLQQAKYPALASEASEVKRAAEAIAPNMLTLDQKDAVKTFFSKAAVLLDKMN